MNPILAVGSVAFDSIKTPFGEANRVVGGAATYFAIAEAITKLPVARSCECGSALKFALITRPEAVPAQLKKDLAPIIGKYLS